MTQPIRIFVLSVLYAYLDVLEDLKERKFKYDISKENGKGSFEFFSVT